MAQRQIIIHRARPKSTRIQNSIIWDESISTAARFSLIAMLSLPDTWDYSVRGMAAMIKVSKDTMGKYLKELEQAGYLRRSQSSTAGGRFGSTQYVLTDTPGDFGEEGPCPKNQDTDDEGAQPCPKNPDTEGETAPPCPNLPDPEKPDPKKSPQKIRTEQWRRTEERSPQSPPAGGAVAERQRRHREPKSAPEWKPERFEGFWRMYPLKKSKQAAIRAWDLLRPDDRLLAAMGRALQRQLASAEWQRKIREEGGQGIPYPATWLNGRRWEDEDQPDRAYLPTPAQEGGLDCGFR